MQRDCVQFFYIIVAVFIGSLKRHTIFDRNRICVGYDMEKKLFSKWRSPAILSLRKLPFWSRDLYLHDILHLWSKFRNNRPICLRDTAKKRFSIWRPSAYLSLQNLDFFCQKSILGMEICTSVPNLIEIGDSRLRYGDKAIFKMAAVRYLEFSKIAILILVI